MNNKLHLPGDSKNIIAPLYNIFNTKVENITELENETNKYSSRGTLDDRIHAGFEVTSVPGNNLFQVRAKIIAGQGTVDIYEGSVELFYNHMKNRADITYNVNSTSTDLENFIKSCYINSVNASRKVGIGEIRIKEI